MENLQGKVVIITGGSRGIGRACCVAFAQAGANIVFTYNKSKKEADKLNRELKAWGADCLSLGIDAKNFNQCKEVIEKTVKRFKRIDVLINNAGIVRDKALMTMSEEDWRDVIDTNLNGSFNMTRAGIITFLKQKRGCIINMSSISGVTGSARQTNYSASKAGIIGFSKALAKEVASYNIRVNAVCPGYIDTDMVNSLRDDFKKDVITKIPLNRMGRPKEVADLCVFLACGKADYITGEAIKIDGGLAI